MTIETIQSFHCDVCGAEESFRIVDNWGAPKDEGLHPEYLRRMNWETVSVEVHPRMTKHENGNWYSFRERFDQTRCPECVQQLLISSNFRKISEEDDLF